MSSIDVLPTLLNLLGGPPAGSSFAGTSQHLAALGQAPVKESEFIPIESDHHGEYRAALLTRHWKLMEWLTVDGSVLKSKLFSRIGDPAEQEDLAPTQRALVHNLHKKLVSWQARTPTALWIDDHTAQIDDDLRESLRALGYVEEDAAKHTPE